MSTCTGTWVNSFKSLLITVQDSILLMFNGSLSDVRRVVNEEGMENSDDGFGILAQKGEKYQ